ncbi:MAG: hypothetical protein KAS90_05875, partial [Candidatus Aenigmarchaeota archaeon]|nr:hypothetical protein [Candidatus Aenigmarchaeota archaeon]
MSMSLAAGSPSSFVAAIKRLIDRIFPPESVRSVNSPNQSIQKPIEIDLPSDKTEDLDLTCILRGTQILCESPTFLEDMVITQPAYVKIKTPHTVKNIDKKSVHIKTLDIIEEFESKTIKLNKTKNLKFEIPLISYGSMEVEVDGKTRTINYSSYLSEETTFSEDKTGKKLKITKTQKGWTQDYKIFSDHALYSSNEIIFSAEVNEPQEITISLDFPDDSTVILGGFYKWEDGAWAETGYTLSVDAPTYFKQEYDWFKINKPREKFNISITGDKGFSALLDPDISSCSNLSTAGSIYTLTTNVSSADTCFTIEADNITLDCDGYTITYSQSSVGYAINNSGGYDNITIKNCNIIISSTTMYAHAIYTSGMENSTITNNTINISNPSGFFQFGILFDSSSLNTISDNTIITYGAADHAIRIEYSSNSNNISSNILTIEGSMLTGGLFIYLSNDSYISSNNITVSGSNYALW